MTTTKEVLHTQGENDRNLGQNNTEMTDAREWKVTFENTVFYIINNGEYIATIYTHYDGQNNSYKESQAKADAELICKAVNERQRLIDNAAFQETVKIALNTHISKLIEKNQRLIDSNRELVETLDYVLAFMKEGNMKVYEIPLHEEIEVILNNAKNILP